MNVACDGCFKIKGRADMMGGRFDAGEGNTGFVWESIAIWCCGKICSAKVSCGMTYGYGGQGGLGWSVKAPPRGIVVYVLFVCRAPVTRCHGVHGRDGMAEEEMIGTTSGGIQVRGL